MALNTNQGILLDFDGVVVNSEPLYEHVEKKLYRQDFGLNIPDSMWNRFKGTTEQDIYAILRDRYGLSIPFNEAMDMKRRLLGKVFSGELTLFPEFHDFYNAVRPHFRIALTTSSAKSLLNIAMEKFGLEPLFDAIITGDDVSRGKPAPDPYILSAESIGLKPERCIVIEDTINGVQSGLSAGCSVVAITTSFPENMLQDAHLVKPSLGEIRTETLLNLIKSREK